MQDKNNTGNNSEKKTPPIESNESNKEKQTPPIESKEEDREPEEGAKGEKSESVKEPVTAHST